MTDPKTKKNSQLEAEAKQLIASMLKPHRRHKINFNPQAPIAEPLLRLADAEPTLLVDRTEGVISYNRFGKTK